MSDPGRTLPVRRFLRATPRVDLAVGAVLTALGLVIAIRPDSIVVTLIGMLTIPAVTLPVMWRRQAPLAACVAVSAGIVVSALPTFDQVRCGVALPAAMLVLYSVASRCDRRSAVRGLAAALCAVVFLSFTDPNLDAGAPVVFVPLCAGVWGVGRLVASRRRAAAALRARSAQLEDQRAQTARLAVAVERTRLTSELDGAVREQIGEIVQLAAQGERELAGDPAASRQAFARIETAGRGSLDDMRGMLGALRSDEHAVRDPRPTLAQLDGLLAQARAGGRVVELDILGERRRLSDGIELAAYRIVEHALVAIDAGDASVRLRFGAEALDIEVEGGHRDGAGVAEEPIVAAREQVAVRGGSFSVRAAGSGRRLLHASLPLTAQHG